MNETMTAKEIDQQAMKRLKKNRHHLTPQQYRTIKGQILAGCPFAAMKGLAKILDRKVATT